MQMRTPMLGLCYDAWRLRELEINMFYDFGPRLSQSASAIEIARPRT